MEYVEVKLLDDKSIEVYYENEWKYELFSVVKYLFDEESIYIKIINNKFINFETKKRIGSNQIKYYINNENLLKIIMQYSSCKTIEYQKYIISVVLERIREISNPEIAIDRVKTFGIKKGKKYKYFYKMQDVLNENHLSNQEIFNEEILNFDK